MPFFIGPVDIKETEKNNKQPSRKKASGPNSLPIKTLKTSQKHLYVLLTYLVNLGFETGTFPEILKTAKVILIFKKGDQQYCNNYRLISPYQMQVKQLKNSCINASSSQNTME